MSRIILKDDFYPDPKAVRATALHKSFEKHEWRPRMCEWLESFPSKPASETLMLTLARIIETSIAYEDKYQGFFRVLTENAWQQILKGSVIVHIDDYDWAGVVGLNENNHGTMKFVRHKASGIKEIRGNHEWTGELLADAADLNKWEVIRTVELCFNRLILFTPRAFHISAPGFGHSIQDAKLTQQFQFNEDRDAISNSPD